MVNEHYLTFAGGIGLKSGAWDAPFREVGFYGTWSKDVMLVESLGAIR